MMMFLNGSNGFGNCFGLKGGLINSGGGMIIMMLVFAVLIGIAVALLTKKSGRQNSGDAALDALKKRLAKGEISEEEYLKRKSVLE